MDKLSVTVKIPALNNAFDFLIPDNMSVREVIQLITRILSSEYGVSDDYNNALLFDMKDSMALRVECSFSQLGITNGTTLILM